MIIWQRSAQPNPNSSVSDGRVRATERDVVNHLEGRMTEARAHRQFGSTEHLASEAIAAYVDGELRMQAYLRASHHISICAECAAAVDAQQQARGALRRSGEMTMPLSPGGTFSVRFPRATVRLPGRIRKTPTVPSVINPPASPPISKRLSRRWRK